MMRHLFAGLAGLVFAATSVTSAAAAARPLVVILADRRGTEAPDLLTPYAILAESHAVDVKVVSATREPVRLTKGHAWVAPQMTLAELARTRPDGPDVVIVPAMTVVEDAARASWLQTQARHGARIMSVCNGAKVLAAAGLLDGRQATVHWFSVGRLSKAYPKVTWRRDARWVTDGPITTTTGITAGEPATLNLLRELAGDDVMRETASRLRLPPPDPRHRGTDYRLTVRGAGVVIANSTAFWRRENVAVSMAQGMDELAFGAEMDGWSRTFRSTAWAAGAPSVVSRHGLTIYASSKTPARFDRRVALPNRDANVATFTQIRAAYGEPTARFVALQFEHPYGAV